MSEGMGEAQAAASGDGLKVQWGAGHERTLFAGRYLLCRQLGAGAMGVVFEAQDTALRNERVALKVLYPHLVSDPTSYALFRSEVLIARRLPHKSIVQIFGHGSTDQGHRYFTMELIDGLTLKQVITGPEYERYSLDDVLEILFSIARALAYAHRQGVVHRDLKPHNVLIGSDGQVKVADFGIAQLAYGHPAQPTGSSFAGTPLYVSPEQIRGEALDERSDVYSFGITACELLCGQPPFNGRTLFEIAQKHLHEPIDLSASRFAVPPWLQQLIERCTAKSLDQRLGSMDEFCSIVRESLAVSDLEESGVYETKRGTLVSLPELELLEVRPDSPLPALVRSFFLTAAVLGAICSFFTQKPMWLLSIPVFVLFAECTKWRQQTRTRFLITFSVLAMLFTVSEFRTVNKRAVALLLRAEGHYGVNLSLLKLALRSPIKKPTPDAAIAAWERRDRDSFWALVHSGMDLSALSAKGETVMHMLCRKNSTLDLERVLKQGADPLTPDARDRTAIQYAVEGGQANALELLLEYAEHPCPVGGTVSPLKSAITVGNLAAVQLLLEHGVLEDPVCRAVHERIAYDPLAHAKQLERVDIVRTLEEARPAALSTALGEQ